jgi:ACS family hexuronate transporter-like MFS transporter
MPRHAVGSVVGIGGMASAIAAIFFAELTGRVLQAGHSYQLLFSIASVSYLLALLIMHWLVPRWEKS